MTEDTRELILGMLRDEEGLRLKPYRCTAGALTIGYGHNLDAKPIRQSAAELILQHDYEDALAAARRLVKGFDRLTPNRQAVLVSMAFQMGEAALAQFKNTLGHIEAGRYDDAAHGMLQSRWAKQTPARAERMARLMVDG